MFLKIKKAIKTTDVIYAVGFDSALIIRIAILLSGCSPIFLFEIHDIRQMMMREDLLGRLFRTMERWVMKGVHILAPTSDSYITGYYHTKLGVTNFETITLENKRWPQEICPAPIAPPQITPLRIGYFGSLRCNVAWAALTRLVANSNGTVEVMVRGSPDGIDNFFHDIETIPGLQYGGPYRDPEDLYEIYSKVNLIWAAGLHGKDSYIWQRTCRFYNACSFQRPIISLIGTDEGDIINHLGIGCCVDLNDIPAAITQIMKITQTELDIWHENLKNLPPSVFIYSDEHERVLDLCAKVYLTNLKLKNQ
jgi:succinoglycan biosynthesis protein ExoL